MYHAWLGEPGKPVIEANGLNDPYGAQPLYKPGSFTFGNVSNSTLASFPFTFSTLRT
jgi:hypothetical protein